MKIISDLLETLAGCDHPVRRVVIGLHWVAVESRYVGLAHTFRPPGKYEVADSGALVGISALALAQRALSWNLLEASLGLAALNSLIEATGQPGNVFDRIPKLADGRKFTIIGRFPFNDEVRKAGATGWFLEMEARRDELPPPACEVVIPQSDLLVVSATSLINHTLPRLLELAADTHAIVLGPSTPMSDVLLRHGADVLAGIAVTDADALFQSVAQGVKSFNKLAGIVALSKDRRDSGMAEKTLPRAAAMAERAVEVLAAGNQRLHVAAIVHDIDASAGQLLGEFARDEHGRGRKIRGLIQEKVPYGQDGELRRALFDIDSAKHFFISQKLGSGSVSCSLDTQADQALDVQAEGGGGYRLFGSCVRKINLLNVPRLEALGLGNFFRQQLEEIKMDETYFGNYKTLVAEAGKFHGHVCNGIAIGTRMKMSGLRRIGINDPKGSDRKKLMVFVEIDRCATDAIMALTGCQPGKRTMKIRDYGKMAATFINLESGMAVRVATRMKQRSSKASDERDFGAITESELFSISDVTVPLRPEDLPGMPLRRVACERCGETVLDGRDVEYQGQTLCQPCRDANDYYRFSAATADAAHG